MRAPMVHPLTELGIELTRPQLTPEKERLSCVEMVSPLLVLEDIFSGDRLSRVQSHRTGLAERVRAALR